MELRHIRYFLEVAETLNFSRAAERLHVAQPALSKQVRDLEEELGTKLFHRTTTKVSLTDAGHYFRQQTRKLIVQLDIAVTGVQQLAKGAAGTLRLGCDWRANSLPIAVATRRFTETNPHLSVQFVELPAHEHVPAVRKRTIDLGFAPSIYLGDTDGLELRRLYGLRLKVALPRGHRLSGKRFVSLSELKNERWLALDTEALPGFRVLMAQILQFTPKYGLTTTSLPGLIAHVVAGHGVGLLPEVVMANVQHDIAVLDTDSTPIDVFAIWPKEGGSPLINSFLSHIEELIADAEMPNTKRAAHRARPR